MRERTPQHSLTDCRIGAVVIGRNEGKRLQTCLRSIAEFKLPIVYVDSGSSDGSVSWAREFGIQVLELDLSTPFTAARARNAGWRLLQSEHPEIELVQFIDGDCELHSDWLSGAAQFLDTNPQVAVVFGRSRERYPEASIYNRLCDLEWNVPPGPAEACGGNSLMRLEAISAVGGFNDTLIAGEEPDLCFRLRGAGWQVHCIETEMTFHDAAMTSWRQWWLRMKRSGYAYANAYHLHGGRGGLGDSKNVRSILVWGMILPAITVIGSLFHLGFSLLLLTYLLQWLRIWRRCHASGRFASKHGGLYAAHCVLSKFPGLLGILSFHYHRLRGEQRGLIEYK